MPSPSQILFGEPDGGCNPRLNKQIAAALREQLECVMAA
jgi:hypothetical protein